MNKALKIAVIVICLIRALSQRFWLMFDNPYIFYNGLAIFELGALLYVRKDFGKHKNLIDFFIVCVLYDLYKYLYAQPYEVSHSEDLGFIIGLGVCIFENKIIQFIKYVFNNYIKRH